MIPAFVLPTQRVGRTTFDARKQTQSKLSELTAYMQEVLGISGILLVKAFTKERAGAKRSLLVLLRRGPVGAILLGLPHLPVRPVQASVGAKGAVR